MKTLFKTIFFNLFLSFSIIMPSLLYSDSSTCNNPNNITVPGTDNNSLNNQTSNYYILKAPSNGTFHIYTTNFSGDMDGYLYSNGNCNNSNLLNYDEKSASNVDLSYDVTAGNFYKIKLYAYSGDSNYTLHIDFSLPLPSSGSRNFTLYRQDNIVGDIQLIGNSVKIDSANGGQCAPTGTNNNDFTAMYADMDDDNNTFNSTSANLVLPVNIKSANILYARLYWQGRVNNSSTIREGTSVKIKTYGQATYERVDTNISRFNYVDRDYQGVADVTQIIKDSINARASTTGYNEAIWVADVYAPDNTNGFGVWSLAIVYKDSTSVLQNISTYDGYEHVYNDTITTTLNDFLTPKKGVVNSNFYVFAGEGDVTYKDSVTLTDKNNATKSLGNNIFKSSIDLDGVNVTNRKPSCQNTIGADIREFSVGTNGKIPIIGNGQTSTIIKLTSNGDEYIPGFFAFSTQLYEPRVCYYIDTIVDSGGSKIFKDGAFITGQEIIPNEDYTFNFWISNMKKNATDTDIEIASKVQVYLNMTNFGYKSSSTNIFNIGTSSFVSVTDQYNADNNYSMPADDLGEYLNSTSTWRVGSGASNTHGGTLDVASGFSDTANIVKINMKGSLSVNDDSTQINLLDYLEFKASFQTDSITIGPGNAQKIAQCQDLDVNGGVAAPAGAYNAVDVGTSVIKTKVSGRAFPIQILSYKTGTTTPQASSKDLTIDIIETPTWTGDLTTDAGLCTNATSIFPVPGTTNLGGATSKNITIPAIPKAYQSVTMRITDSNSVSCATDPFAIRPEKFTLSTPAGQVLTTLASGQDFFFPITANLDGATTATPNYTITSGLATFPTLDADKVTYLSTGVVGPLNGTLIISPLNFSFTNGLSSGMPVSFDDVGQVEINLIDRTWAQVDAADGTPQDCTTNGAFICGKITPTYIPDHFTFVIPTIRNDNGGSNTGDFTYIANSIPANPIPFTMAGRIDTKIEARNSNNVITTNFDQAPTKYENPININVTIAGKPLAVNVTSIAAATLAGAPLGFTNGSYTIPWNSTDVNRMLRFNFTRQVNTAVNPFQVLPADVTLTASSTYGATTVTQDATSGIAGNIGQSATFIYGRSHAPRQEFVDTAVVANHTALIYYEVYCNGIINGNNCDKTLLPNSINATYSNDPRWFINTRHTQTEGTAGTVAEKSNAHVITIVTQPTGSDPDEVVVIYNGAKGYPYTKTMTMTSSAWLIYNKYNARATKNDFVLEFYKDDGAYVGSGKSEYSVKIKKSATISPNENKSWW